MGGKAGAFHGSEDTEHRSGAERLSGSSGFGRSGSRPARIGSALLILLLSAAPALAAGGDLIWTTASDLAAGFDSTLAIATGTDRVFSAGFATRAAGDTDFMVRAFDSATGRPLWAHDFDLLGGNDAASGVVSTGGLVIAVGSAQKAFGDSDFVVRALDGATGALVWEDRFDLAGGRDVAVAVATTVGLVFAGGFATNSDGHRDIVVRAYDAKTGTLVWHRQIDVLGARDQVTLGSLDVAGGTVFVGALGTNLLGNRDGLVFALDAQTGVLRWQDQFDNGGNDIAEAVSARWGRLFVAGFRSEPDFTARFLLRAYDAQSGTLLWENSAPTGALGFDIGYAVTSAGSRVFAAGLGTHPDGRTGYFVRAYDAASGAILWEDLVDQGGSGGVAVAVFAQRDQVITAGIGGPRCGSVLASDCDMISRAYDGRSGALLWEDAGDLAGMYDQANALAVQGKKLFVGGLGFRGSGDADSIIRAIKAD